MRQSKLFWRNVALLCWMGTMLRRFSLSRWIPILATTSFSIKTKIRGIQQMWHMNKLAKLAIISVAMIVDERRGCGTVEETPSDNKRDKRTKPKDAIHLCWVTEMQQWEAKCGLNCFEFYEGYGGQVVSHGWKLLPSETTWKRVSVNDMRDNPQIVHMEYRNFGEQGIWKRRRNVHYSINVICFCICSLGIAVTPKQRFQISCCLKRSRLHKYLLALFSSSHNLTVLHSVSLAMGL